MALSERALIVFAPDTVIESRLQQEIETLTEQGFEIVELSQVQLSLDQAQSLAADGRIASKYTEGPSAVLIVQRQNVFDELNDITLDNALYSQNAYNRLKMENIVFPKPKKLERTVVVILNSSDRERAEALVMSYAKKEQMFVLCKEERNLTAEDLKPILGENSLHSPRQGESIIFVLEKHGAIEEMLLALGPEKDSPSIAPNSIRAELSEPTAIVASKSFAQAQQWLNIFFESGFPLQTTLALIKPDAYSAGYVNSIMDMVRDHGFKVVCSTQVRLSRARAEQFYAEHKEREFFGGLVDFMTSAPIVAMVLCKASAISCWRTLIGPTNTKNAKDSHPNSVRALFGTDATRNAVHGSDSIRSAHAEIKFFFPKLQSDHIPNREQIHNLIMQKQDVKEGNEESSLNQVLLRGLTHLCRTKPVGLDAVNELAQWLSLNNPRAPKVTFPKREVVQQTGVVEKLKRENNVKKLQIVFVLGGPGSGKGTQCERMVNQLGYYHISSGDCLRAAMAADSEEGKLIAECVAHGKLVPDDLVLSLIEQTMAKSGAHKFLIDGFPRRIDQAFAFENKICECDCVLFFDAPDSVLTERLLHRGKSSGRSDDNEATITKRLRTYHEESVPAIQHYSKFNKVRTIDANHSVEHVWNDVQAVIH